MGAGATWGRWALVGVGAAVLVVVPLVVRSWPVPAVDLSAAEALGRVRASTEQGYSGYVETRGTLALPTADRFTDVGRLFGEQTRLRVWWRGEESWRVDRLTNTGESDLFRADDGETWRWRYENFDLDLAGDPDIRLPRTDDLLPPQMADFLLAGAQDDEVSRIPGERVAGRATVGLRLTPASGRSSITRADLWSDARTGLPLRVLVYGRSADRPALTSEFRELSLERPPARLIGISPPPGVDVDLDPPLDVADAANRYADVRPPSALAGLDQDGVSDGAVGVYGTGATRMIVVPLWDRAAEPLRDQLEVTPSARFVEEGAVLTVDPLSLLLTEYRDGSGWLLSGTVTRRVLLDAAAELEAIYG